MPIVYFKTREDKKTARLDMLISHLLLLRPAHWIKNLFLFIPLFFAGELLNLQKIYDVCVGWCAFSLAASSVYILNDIRDIESDRIHPEKRFRPIPAGKVSVSHAVILMSVSLIAGFIISYFISLKFLFIVSLYLLVNILYSFGLKNISILDILLLSAGFNLRIKAGGVAADIGVSEWLMIMVFLLALLMAIAKRRDDLLIKASTGKDMRKSIGGYNLDFMNVSLALVSAIIIVAYLMYTLSPEVEHRFGTYRLYYTGLFVVAGILRYLQITYVQNSSGSPTRILYKDRFLQITIILWLLSFYFLIYFPNIHIFDR
ncbi:4-hydroxybenzoate polyprenyltransferase [Thermoflavifilum aggregans]|uniref:4-hydroxybenzoate polyprenyltransferase n=1 Tax=Thermoflavifilum aggregans TaxID=454188 RepID=A0A2M9CXD3_9BACT|nr:decaprenyl-phosphate phosphoribosyltransferase [Thermoflavifilum aggregans]PJJ76571.1 4-hydroxybenzoate polyprenyltransferase [Thermoflavifilum aggregans]